MTKEKKKRDKGAEKAVKARLQKTHLKSVRVLGSEVEDGVATVYVLRIVGTDNYLFKVRCEGSGASYSMSGLIPVSDYHDYGEYRVYNPKPASSDALRPTAKERSFKGYN